MPVADLAATDPSTRRMLLKDLEPVGRPWILIGRGAVAGPGGCGCGLGTWAGGPRRPGPSLSGSGRWQGASQAQAEAGARGDLPVPALLGPSLTDQ